MYDSVIEDHFQTDPLFYSEKDFPPESWTDSTESYIRTASKICRCVDRARRAFHVRLIHHVTINFNFVEGAEEARKSWNRAKGFMKKDGIVALWVREPNDKNKLHYHLVTRNAWPKKEVEKAIKRALDGISSRVFIEPVTNSWQLTRYVFKARVPKGESSDIFAKKRRLFRKGTGLRKHGTIGEFWPVSVSDLRQYFKVKERRVRENYSEARPFSLWAQRRFPGMPLYSIRRRVSYHWDSTFEPWATRLHLA